MTNLQPHQQRVVDEKLDLDEKLQKLELFVTSSNFTHIVKDEAEQQRLIRQCAVMKEYSNILEERILNFLEYQIHTEPERLVYRVNTEPERRIFAIDATNMPPSQAAEYVDQIKSQLER